jgi:glycerol-3-phosphate acyltransferase PlsX
LVFKSHGSADELAFENALNRAYDAARNQLLDRVRDRIAHAAPLLMGAQAERSEPVVTSL